MLIPYRYSPFFPKQIHYPSCIGHLAAALNPAQPLLLNPSSRWYNPLNKSIYLLHGGRLSHFNQKVHVDIAQQD
jgi:hypothetical protein